MSGPPIAGALMHRRLCPSPVPHRHREAWPLVRPWSGMAPRSGVFPDDWAPAKSPGHSAKWWCWGDRGIRRATREPCRAFLQAGLPRSALPLGRQLRRQHHHAEKPLGLLRGPMNGTVGGPERKPWPGPPGESELRRGQAGGRR
jgi:hypothetical protein